MGNVLQKIKITHTKFNSYFNNNLFPLMLTLEGKTFDEKLKSNR